MEIKKGRIYKFKSWEQMEKEFGLHDSGSIACMFGFTKEMKFLCNKEYKKVGHDNFYKNGKGKWTMTTFLISDEMLQINNIHKRID